MSKKVFGLGDLIVIRESHHKGIWITPSEIKSVVAKVGEVAYTLYSIYRTTPFKESEDISDKAIADLIGWNQKKVQKYRLMLEKSDLLTTIRYGTKTDGTTKMFVGELQVALFNAGLPADVINPRALRKLTNELNLPTTNEIIKNVVQIEQHYRSDPDSYK